MWAHWGRSPTAYLVAELAKCLKERYGASYSLPSGPQSFNMPDGFSVWEVKLDGELIGSTVTSFFRSHCEGCYHCLRPSGCSSHLRDGVPSGHGNDLYDGYMSILSPVFQQVPSRPFLSLRCERCNHFLLSSACCHHLGDSVPFKHGKDFFDGYRVSGRSEMASQVGRCACCFQGRRTSRYVSECVK